MANFPFIPPSSFPQTKSQYLPCELMPATLIAERVGSGHVSFGTNGVTGTREWVVPWADPTGKTYIDYISQLIGLTTGGGPGGQPTVTYPDVFSAELPWLFCQEVDMKGEDCAGVDAWGRIAYRRAILTAKYKAYEANETFHVAAQSLSMLEGSYAYLGPYTIPQPPPYVPAPQDIVMDADGVQQQLNDLFQLLLSPDLTADQRAQIQAKCDQLNEKLGGFRTQPSAPDPGWVLAYKQWLANAVAQCANPGCSDDYFQANKNGSVAQPLTKVIPLGEYSLERHQVLAPDFWAYIGLLGAVNAFFFLGFPPWTAMFSGIEGKRGTLPNGSRVWNLTLKFHFNPNSWNHVYRPEKGQWEAVASVKAGAPSVWYKNTLSPNPDPAFVGPQLPDGTLSHNWLYRPADFSPLLFYS